MESRKLRFALFGNIYQTKKSASIQKVLSCLAEHDAELYVDMEYYYFLKDNQRISIDAAKIFTGDDFDADFVISMGGDGTFLKAASRVRQKMIPILGVNMGRLGFLADVSPSDIEKCMDALYAEEYSIENRALIQVELDGEKLEGFDCALNDVAILKRDTASMISIRANINGEYLTTYQADGLVISTPTGSTAYSLSNGGPIIVPGTKVFSMTAVAPHSMNIRPIVLSDSSEISLTVESRSHNFLIAIDGRSEKCKEGTRITLRRAPFDVKVVKRSGQRYFNTLREKMMWGVDAR
ncbi:MULTISPECIES: NAD kinase [unclassified Prevotella]|uniref:NAD kinase n=1 Tax=unclassified Prevotella TaxID=2638335 RepID=UPI00056130DC|nr:MULTISPECIES: NAD kinase [unclassified Prevotella]MCR5471001.1 NAD kinase [Prevotella sp.]SEW25467.1 NAD+ kinase [Prevotella sp. khp7]